MLMLIFRGTSRQAAGGGCGGKLDSRVSSGSANGGVEDRREGRIVDDEGIRPDDPGRGSTGVGARLGIMRGAGMASSVSQRLEQLGVAGPRLPLTPPPEVATPGDAEAQDNHGQ